MLSSLRRQRSAAARALRAPDTAVLLSALPDPVLALDRGDIVRFVNPAAEQFFGTSAARSRGIRCPNSLRPKARFSHCWRRSAAAAARLPSTTCRSKDHGFRHVR
jgi:PAS domain-containing protein